RRQRLSVLLDERARKGDGESRAEQPMKSAGRRTPQLEPSEGETSHFPAQNRPRPVKDKRRQPVTTKCTKTAILRPYNSFWVGVRLRRNRCTWARNPG